MIVSIRPPSAQRRKVSSLTPSRLAASLIRNVGIHATLTQMRLKITNETCFVSANAAGRPG